MTVEKQLISLEERCASVEEYIEKIKDTNPKRAGELTRHRETLIRQIKILKEKQKTEGGDANE